MGCGARHAVAARRRLLERDPRRAHGVPRIKKASKWTFPGDQLLSNPSLLNSFALISCGRHLGAVPACLGRGLLGGLTQNGSLPPVFTRVSEASIRSAWGQP